MTESAEEALLSPRLAVDLAGHRGAERAFLDAWSGGRLAHSWLISGPRGIGKATLAFRIARFALSHGGVPHGGAGATQGLFADNEALNLTMSPDNLVFRRIASGGHSDLKVLERLPDPAKGGKLPSDIPAELARSVGSFLSLTPGEGGWRVVIVDSLDELNRHGANALLKIVEEPPRNALILLISHSPGNVLPTIRSRCRTLVLQPLSEATLLELLAKYLPDLPKPDRLELARLAPGSIGDALALAQGDGLALYRGMIALLEPLPRMNVEALHAFAEAGGRSEGSLRIVARLLSGWLSGAIARVARGEPGLIPTADLDRWIELWEKTNHSFERTEAINLDRRQSLLNAFLAIESLCRS